MISNAQYRETTTGTFRRLYERKIYNTDIVFSINDQIFQGRLKDISVGGAFIRTRNTQHIWEGDMATISIPFTKGGKHVKRTGSILWKNSTGFAVTFSN